MPTTPPSRSFDETLSHLMGVGLGLLFIVGGWGVQRLQTHEQATLLETQGTVVDSISRPARDTDSTTYAPIIEFVVDDQAIRFTGVYESYVVSEGSPVRVRYHADAPATSARVVNPWEDLTAWSMVGLGAVAVAVSLWELLPGWWQRVKG